MKKNYSLALWWWAAIWLLHIWIIKKIEEENIKINEISWTSMWAIIAAFYAMWKSSIEMEQFANEISVVKLLDFDLKNGLLKWNKIMKKLKTVFSDTLIEDLDISLKIVATNIDTWEKKVFEKWKIIDAVRASISLPWIFIPHEIWDYNYIDGWIINNLPIEVLKWKNIIAVSAIKNIDSPLKNKRKIMWMDFHIWFFNMNFQILQRSLILLMKYNEDVSLKTKWKDITFIKCNTDWYDVYSFNKVDELVKIWYDRANIIL